MVAVRLSLRLPSVNVQQADGYIDLKLEGQQGQNLGRRNVANNQTKRKQLKRTRNEREITKIMGEGDFNKEDVVSIVKCYRVAKSDRLKNVPLI